VYEDGWSILWLTATDAVIDPADVRAWWNLKDTDDLDKILREAPKCLIGPNFWDSNDLEGSGPARRVFDLLYLRGTTPDYVFPTLDEELVAAILAALTPRALDQVEGTTAREIGPFLTDHLGWHIVPMHLDPREPD
jgi:hypothetical protein